MEIVDLFRLSPACYALVARAAIGPDSVTARQHGAQPGGLRGSSTPSASQPVTRLADTIAFTADQAYPESASWSEKQQVFIVSSVRIGEVGKVTPQGQYTAFISDARLISSVGLLVDDARNTL